MPRRWSILALLFVVRATMAFQFQSVAAVAPLLNRDGIDLANIGLLIGLYFAPGSVLALPGGAIGKKFGDKRMVLVGLALMIAGGLIMALSSLWTSQIAGRLIAGTGGVLLNVLMTKIVADWFTGREVSTAMAIFVNSWPVGIAASLLTLPILGVSFGVNAVYLAVTALIACAALVFAIVYQAPVKPHSSLTEATALEFGAVLAIVAAGLVWTFYNIGFAMVFSFGPSMLAERGWTVAAAGPAISVVLWLAALSVPLGGILADRTKRHDVVLVAGCVAFAMLLVMAAHGASVVPTFVALGIVCGLPAGAIMSLPTRILTPGTRAVGMGLFYAVFYIGMMAGPALAGRYAAWAGSANAPFEFGAGLLLTCPVLLWTLHRARLWRGTVARHA